MKTARKTAPPPSHPAWVWVQDPSFTCRVTLGKAPNLSFLIPRMGMIWYPFYRGIGRIYEVMLVTYVDLCLAHRKYSVKS